MFILDWQMPGHGGLEICRRWQARATEFYTCVILVTSSGSAEDAARALDAGADDFMTKPSTSRSCARVRARKRIAEQQGSMARSRAYLEAALAHMAAACSSWIQRGVSCTANPAPARMSGMPLDQVLRLTRDDLGPAARGTIRQP